MIPMLFVSGIGPLEGSLISTLRIAAPDLPVINVHRPAASAYGTPAVPPWAQSLPGASPSILARRYFRSLATERKISFVIAVGVAAINEASELRLGLPIIGLVPRGDVDFSLRKTSESAAFASASQTVSALYFDCLHDMDKASSHGSQAPHLLLPLFSPAAAFLAPSAEVHHTCVIVPDSFTDDQVATVRLQIESAELEDVTSYEITSDQNLFLPKDFESSRVFPGTMRYRISNRTTHMLLLGDSRNHTAVLSALEHNHPARYAVESTIANRDIALRTGISSSKLGQGAALFARFKKLLSAGASSEDDEEDFQHRTVLDGSGLLNHFAQSLSRRVPWWYEEEICEPSAGTFDIFFSVAAIENRVDGARPLRIRSVAETFPSSDALTVRLTADENLFRRRARAIRAMIDHGAKPRQFYGENSTAPMVPEAALRLGDLLRAIRPFGLRSGWFVRDLHWLSEDADYSANSDISVEGRIERGLEEMRTMQNVVDVFFAPSDNSTHMFSGMLGKHELTDLYWRSLPPGMSEYRTLPASDSRPEGPVRLVYSGGYGHIYRMGTLISALSMHEVDVDVDWFIRPADSQRLQNDLDEHQCSGRHNLTTRDFLSFRPISGKVLGLILLDSNYARNSFPFKLMSYLEKRIPVAVFDDMAAAEFVRDNGLGIVCERENFSIAGLIDQAETFFSQPVDWEQILANHSWTSRMETARSALRDVR